MKKTLFIIFFVIFFSIFQVVLLPLESRSQGSEGQTPQETQTQIHSGPVPGEPQPPPPQPVQPQIPAQEPAQPIQPPTVQQPVTPPSQPVQPPMPAVQPAQPPALPSQPKVEVPQATQPPVKPPSAKRGEVSFNFDDADIYSVIQTIFGDILRVNYIVDPNVRGRVTFRSVAPVAKEDVLPLMEVILRLNGIGIVEEGGLYRIVPIGDMPKEPANVGIGRESEKVQITGKALLQVVPIQYIQSTEMIMVLTPFLSKNAVIVDVPKSNYIIIVDTDANVKRLLRLVELFDSEQLKKIKPKVFVYAVQNSKAKDIAAMLQQIFLGGKAPTPTPRTTTPVRTTTPGQPMIPATLPPPPIATPMGGHEGGEALVSDITRIFPDEVTNTIIILATPEDYALIEETIKKIDIVARQVVIEGLIARVDLTDNLSFGLAWSFNTDINIKGFKPFKRDINLSGNVLDNPGIINNDKGVATIPSKGFTFVGTDPKGFTRAVLTALAEESKAKVLAAPHVLVSDNREARIQVGRQVPIATSTTTTLTSTTITGETASTVPVTSTIQYKDIGIILKVKPQVNDSGLISLEISQEISSLGETVRVGGQDEISINKTEATTNLVAQDGDTIIIGGLIQEDVSKSKDGIPLLSKIPIIGHLFGNTTDKNTRTELIILLTPHVIKNLQEAADVTSDYVDRYKGVTKDKKIDKFIKERGQKE